MKTKTIAALFSLALTLLGSAQAQSVDSLPIPNTLLFEPYSVAVDYADADGSVYITDGSNDRVLKYNPKTGILSVFANIPVAPDASPEGLAIVQHPVFGRGLAVAVPAEFTVRFISLATRSISLLAGASGVSGSADGTGGAGGTSRFRSPAGLAAAADGTIYVADLGGNSIRVIDTANPPNVTTLPIGGLNRPAAVALDGSDLYIADNRNNAVKVVRGGAVVATLGVPQPRGLLWVGGNTGLLIASDNHAIYQAFGLVEGVYAGEPGVPGSAPGPVGAARFNQPVGMVIDAQGQILVADLKNDAIRRINRSLAAVPEIDLPAGTYTNTINLVVKSSDPLNFPNSTFHYTTDGTDPTQLDTRVTGPIAISEGPTPLKIRAFDPDFGASAVVSNKYDFAVSPLSFVINGKDWGTFVGGQTNNLASLTFYSATEGVTFRYTVDGTQPTTNSPAWTTRDLASNTVLRVIGMKNGYANSQQLSNNFHFFVNKPVMIYTNTTSHLPIPIIVQTDTDGARLFYTTDLTLPTATNLNRTEIVNKVQFFLTRTGPFRVLGEKPGYDDSNVGGDFVGDTFNLKVAPTTIRATATNSNNDITVELENETPGAEIRYTVNGAVPTKTTGTVYSAPFTLSQNGTLRIVAFRENATDKFEPSSTVEQAFGLSAGKPELASVIPGNSPTNVFVTIKSSTVGATIRWIVNGDPKTAAAATVPAGTPFEVSTNGTLSVVATRAGYVDSEVVSFPVTLQVSNPQINVTGGINSVTVSAASITPTAVIRYTLDGSNPLTNLNALIYTAPIVVDTNANLSVVATNASYLPSDILTRALVVTADSPRLSPPGGFFQDGTLLTISVDRATPAFSTASTVYYTLNGDEPTTNSFRYTGPFTVDATRFSSPNLGAVRARAFAEGVNASGVITGELSNTNKIGIAREITDGGSGATLIVPVVVGLKDNTELRSLQYRVQVWPITAGAPNLGPSDLSATTFGTNDFIVITGSLDGAVTNEITVLPQSGGAVKTNELMLSFIANAANLRLRNFGTINLLTVKLPNNAAPDQQYGIRVLEASGTTDGAQNRVVFGTTPESSRIIRVRNIPYIAGDTSPGRWYNAGDFGDGDLDNSDVNNAFYASLSLRVPVPGSDAFNAMDVFPLDVEGFDFAGDGAVRFLDWNIIQRRSLRLDQNNWVRHWTNLPGFTAPISVVSTGLTRNTSSFASSAEIIAAAAADGRWFRPARIEAQVRQSAEPGAQVRVPILLEVKQNFEVTGLQFAALIESSDPSAPIPALSFTTAPSLPAGIPASGLPAGQVGYAWRVGAVNFSGGVHPLGAVTFTVPETAAAGTTYTIRFFNADGAENIDTQYDFETLRGTVVVRGEAPPSPFGRLTDEWLRRYFGRIDNLLAYAAGDADGDGVSNWDEFQAGTNPTDLRLQRLSDLLDRQGKGFRLRFFAAAGVTYVIESAPSATGPWTQVATGIVGDGSIKEFLDESNFDATKFYRIRLKQ